jgi:hypothetical protein
MRLKCSCAKRRIFVTKWWFFVSYSLGTPLASPSGPRSIACNSKVWHTQTHRYWICAYTVIQEIKRDIIYRRMNLPQSVQQVTASQWPAAHLDSIIHRLHSYLQYIGLVKCVKATETCQIRPSHRTFTTDPGNKFHLKSSLIWITMHLSQSCHDNLPLALANTIMPTHNPCTPSTLIKK